MALTAPAAADDQSPSTAPTDSAATWPSEPLTLTTPAPTDTTGAPDPDANVESPAPTGEPAAEADGDAAAPESLEAPSADAPAGRLAAPAPAAVTTARLTGIITDGGTALGAPSVAIAFYRVVDGKLVKQGSTTTDANGVYTSPALPAGSYKIKATPPPTANIQVQTCGAYGICKSTFDTANPITLTAGATYGDFILP